MAQAGLNNEKNWKSKISLDCPFMELGSYNNQGWAPRSFAFRTFRSFGINYQSPLDNRTQIMFFSDIRLKSIQQGRILMNDK